MNKKDYGTVTRGIPVAVGVGTLSSLLVMIIGAAVMTLLLANESIGENAMGYGVLLITMLSVVIGSLISILLVRSQVLIVGLCTALAFALVLLAMTALFFSGQYSGVPVMLLVMTGSAVAVALIVSRYLCKQKSYRRKSKL